MILIKTSELSFIRGYRSNNDNESSIQFVQTTLANKKLNKKI